MEKIRLDKLLVDTHNLSRQQAIDLIKDQLVSVDNTITPKPSKKVCQEAVIKIKAPTEQEKWVSRAGLKVSHAIAYWNIKIVGHCLDIGASTGGFTEVLLTRGAKKVYAVDVGHGQLVDRLRNDPKVINLEKINARYLTNEQIPELVDFCCIDVSFISLTLILPKASLLIKDGGLLLALIKPQFEVGKTHLGKNGIVKDNTLHKQVIDKILNCCKENQLTPIEHIASPIDGKNGNKEFLILLRKQVLNPPLID